MTGEEFCKWLNSKKEIKACEIDFTLDPKNPLAIVLLNIQITADNEKMVIAYPKLTDSEDETMVKAVSVLLVLNRLMEQYGIDKSFCYFSAINDGGIFEAKQEAEKIIHDMRVKKGGKNNEK